MQAREKKPIVTRFGHNLYPIIKAQSNGISRIKHVRTAEGLPGEVRNYELNRNKEIKIFPSKMVGQNEFILYLACEVWNSLSILKENWQDLIT